MAKKTKKQEKTKFSFDQEIIIGVTKKEDTKKEEVKKKKKSSQKRNKKQTTRQQNKNKSIKHKTKPVTKKVVISAEEQEINRKKRKRIGRILKYSSLSILFIILIVSAMFSPLFNIKVIQVQGNKKITEKEIISLSQIQINQNIFQLSNYKIRKQVKENPYIEEISIIRKFPSNVILKVEEREPAYLLEYAGNYLYLDKHGYILEIAQEKLELPILQDAVTPTTEFTIRKSIKKRRFRKITNCIKNNGTGTRQ